MTREKKEPKERILLRNNWQRREEIEKHLRDVVSIANNTVIPVCKALGMTVTLADAVEWVYDEECFREAFIKQAKRDAKAGRYFANVIETAAYDDFTNQLKQYPYPVVVPYVRISAAECKLLRLQDDVLSYDDAALTEYTNVYLTDSAQIEAYHRIEELCKTLDVFFENRMPVNDALNSWASIVYPTKDGFKVSHNTDFSKFIKK